MTRRTLFFFVELGLLLQTQLAAVAWLKIRSALGLLRAAFGQEVWVRWLVVASSEVGVCYGDFIWCVCVVVWFETVLCAM